jgi:hypothetical protein
MASNGPAESGGQVRAAPVIRHTPVAGAGAGPVTLWHVLPAGVLSVVLHFALAALFLFITVSGSAAPLTPETAVIETKVEDNPQEKNLENEDIGNDPDLPTNYNIDRIEDVSVPGPVNPNEAVGIVGAPEGPPMTIPPPPGFGGNTGQGGGIDDPNKFGAGNLFGTAGGMGGPKMLPGGFGGRSGATREQMVREGGGNGRSEAAVARGLKWLSLHQAADGHWSLDSFNQAGKCNCNGFGQQDDVAGTAFGLLPLLGAGETHKGTGKNHLYAKNVERGLKWLTGHQAKDGNFGGTMYSHGLATIAICEAYGLTSDPQLKAPAQRAVDYIVQAQHSAGGWRYGPKQAGDTSVTGWEVMALKSAQMAGLSVPKETLQVAGKFLDSVATSDGAGYGYTSPPPAAAPSAMTAVGLLCRQYLGWGPRNLGIVKGVAALKKMPPTPSLGNMYYYYYATQVMHHAGGEAWQGWNEGTDAQGKKLHPGMRDALIEKQDQGTDAKHPHLKGSWSPQGDVHGGAGGRVMITSLSLLSLEVYYRHLPLYRRDMGGDK